MSDVDDYTMDLANARMAQERRERMSDPATELLALIAEAEARYLQNRTDPEYFRCPCGIVISGAPKFVASLVRRHTCWVTDRLAVYAALRVAALGLGAIKGTTINATVAKDALARALEALKGKP